MKLDPSIHAGRHWRVSTLCPDFRVLDVWRLPVHGAAGDFPELCRIFVENGHRTDSAATSFLFWLRFRLGALFRLDRPVGASVAERLTADDRRRDRGGDAAVDGMATPVYVFDDEALYEVSNRTIHALVHLGWVDAAEGGCTAEMTVYIRSRGRLSDAYMALIAPFRHHVVYPALLARIGRAWAGRAAAATAAVN
jgi:hypothetical protein